MEVIIEVESDLIDKQAFYTFCARHGIMHFKNISTTHYYAKVNQDKAYWEIINYLEDRAIEFKKYLSG